MQPRWLEACLQGELAAQEEMINEYQSEVYRLALSILNDPQDAEDALQEIFLSALRGLKGFRGQSHFKTWLFSIAIHACQTRLQKQRALQRLAQALFFFTQSETESDHEQQVDVWMAVQALDDKHRLPLLLRYYNRLAVDEIAEMLHIPAGTVHSRLNTARQKIREALQDDL